jgi:branched-chain amino acid transport system ATP-binding protein
MADSKEFLRISNLQSWYGESHILHGVDMTVNEGEVVTLLGRNGAGRTTTVKSILGLVGRRTGSITIRGQETVNWAPHQIAKLGIGYCPEERGIFSALTCEENLMLPPVIAPNGMSVEEIYDMFPNLLERRNSPGTRLSGGEQQMLAVGRILRTGARFLLLDEISEGLAPVIVQALARMIKALKAKGFKYCGPVIVYAFDMMSVMLVGTTASTKETRLFLFITTTTCRIWSLVQHVFA